MLTDLIRTTISYNWPHNDLPEVTYSIIGKHRNQKFLLSHNLLFNKLDDTK